VQVINYSAIQPAEKQISLLPGIVDDWAGKDTQAAAEWVRTLPTGEAKDAAIGSLAAKISIEDYESAMAWAGAIQNEGDRIARQEQLARYWLRQDPARARAWISGSALPPETRKELLQ